jgi:hypothetical protein
MISVTYLMETTIVSVHTTIETRPNTSSLTGRTGRSGALKAASSA